MLHRDLPDHDEVCGALALMLLTHARSETRTDDDGDLVVLADQDRAGWDDGLLAEGIALIEEVLPRGHVGRYQLQASIAAVHAEASTHEATDWLQICVLYDMLQQIAPSPAVTLNHAVAIVMAVGPGPAIDMVEELVSTERMRRHHRTHAVLGHLHERNGDLGRAVAWYRKAARLTASLPEQRYLNRRIATLEVGLDW